jgi:PhnB protein
MSVNVTNHLNFRGDARAALEFYQSVFGGDITIVTYKGAHNVQAPAEADRVMWRQVAAKNGFTGRIRGERGAVGLAAGQLLEIANLI